jgi:putative peptidoglycan lipid II flippase
LEVDKGCTEPRLPLGRARRPLSLLGSLGRRLSGGGYGSGYSLLSAGNIIIAVLTYARQALVADIFGMSWKTDAYAVAMVLPVLMRRVVSYAFNTAFIPVYSDAHINGGREAADRLVSRVLTWVFLVGGATAAALVLSGTGLIRMVGPGLDPEGVLLSARMVRILVLIIVLNSANGVLDALLIYRHRYLQVTLLRNGSVLVSLLIVAFGSGAMGIYALPVSVAAAPLLVFPLCVWLVLRGGSRLQPLVDPRDPRFGTLVRMSGPVVVAAVAAFAGPIFDKMLASYLESSSVTALEYADRIKMMVYTSVLAPLVALAGVSLSRRAAQEDIGLLKANLLSYVRWSSFISLPVTVLITALSTPLVVALFRRGSFGVEDARLVGYALAFYAPWLAQFGAGSVATRGFHALKDSLTPASINVFAMICNVLLNFILVGPLGIGGLALATTVSSTGKTVFMFWSLRRKIGPLGAAATVREHLRLLLGVGGMLAVILGGRMLWPVDLEAPLAAVILRVCLVAGGALAAYLVLLRAAGSTQLRDLRKRAAARLRGG